MEPAGDRVLEVLAPCVVNTYMLRARAGAEVAADSELTDEVAEGLVVRVAPSFGAQQRHRGVGGVVPVRVEVVCCGIEEAEPGEVDRPEESKAGR